MAACGVRSCCDGSNNTSLIPDNMNIFPARFCRASQILGRPRLELRLLMNKAEQASGGGVVSIIAYKGDQVAAHEELKLIDETRRAKKCDGHGKHDHTPPRPPRWYACLAQAQLHGRAHCALEDA